MLDARGTASSGLLGRDRHVEVMLLEYKVWHGRRVCWGVRRHSGREKIMGKCILGGKSTGRSGKAHFRAHCWSTGPRTWRVVAGLGARAVFCRWLTGEIWVWERAFWWPGGAEIWGRWNWEAGGLFRKLQQRTGRDVVKSCIRGVSE